PFGGGFEANRQNRIRIETEKVEGDGANRKVSLTPEYDQARAINSAAVSLGVAVHTAQMRASTALALS
ncbi:hypothetical protein, partial [Enterococcus faecium]|uniref:hypothetical protein n=1 Tax=Enterococcus faecium TaxID=1352 RepID=UPI003F42E215